MVRRRLPPLTRVLMRRSIIAIAAAFGLPTLAQVNTPSTAPETPRSTESPDRENTPAAKTPPSKDSKDPSTLNRVEVVGTTGENDMRRASTAAKIVIGNEEIERFGDSSVGEVLKRLPGVTTGGRPGRGG
ncbi:MAG: TonB-dependent receptor plug domain-containing protein, partial [Pseudomonadota bacterium]